MATELEVTIRFKYEPNPADYIDEGTTIVDMTPEKMAEIDNEEFNDDPSVLFEKLDDRLEDASIIIEPAPEVDEYTYFTKSITQRAVLYDGGNAREVMGVFGNIGIEDVADQLSLSLTTADGHVIPCYPGQYVMEDNKPGTFYPCNMDMFSKKYERRI